ncbi:hypothetical protein GH714_026196 [Hevea brasiliensis]|uniref:Uncharacterized protein n=1 Tax=Hevea brasiliensis TaxID=3981 RepID=A0A6A6KTW8_HEVBR|nr:hypothetical protein GH714_026196 [Hevea brasiliensis]
MEIEVSSSSNLLSASSVDLVVDTKNKAEEYNDRVRLRRKTLKAVLEQCQRALELFGNTDGVGEDDNDDNDKGRGKLAVEDQDEDEEPSRDSSVASPGDGEAYELCDLLKSRVECPDFLEKLECAQWSAPQNISEEGSSWDMVNEHDLWECDNFDSDQEGYVLVRQEDIVEGIACFMAAYLLSLKQTKLGFLMLYYILPCCKLID